MFNFLKKVLGSPFSLPHIQELIIKKGRISLTVDR